MNRISTSLAFAGLAFAVVFAAAHTAMAQPASLDAQSMASEKVVTDFYREVWQSHHAENAPKFMAKDVIEHNPTMGNGIEGFMAHVGEIWHGAKPTPIKPVLDPKPTLIMASGDMVLVMDKRERPDPGHAGQTYDAYWFDLFRIKDGKIVEHWDPAAKRAMPAKN